MATERLNTQELYDFALSFVPATGEISYRDLHAAIRASEHPEATAMLPELKKRKAVTARVSVENGVLSHTYSRGG